MRYVALPGTSLLTVISLQVGYIALLSISLMTVISLSRNDYCPALFIPLLQVVYIALPCTSLLTVISLEGYCIVRVWWSLSLCCFTLGVDTPVTLFFSCLSLCVEFKHSLHGYSWLLLWFYSLLYKIYVIKLYFNSKNLCVLLPYLVQFFSKKFIQRCNGWEQLSCVIILWSWHEIENTIFSFVVNLFLEKNLWNLIQCNNDN